MYYILRTRICSRFLYRIIWVDINNTHKWTIRENPLYVINSQYLVSPKWYVYCVRNIYSIISYLI